MAIASALLVVSFLLGTTEHQQDTNYYTHERHIMTNDLHTRISDYAVNSLDELREINQSLLEELEEDFSKIGEWLVTEYVIETRTHKDHDITVEMYDLFQQWQAESDEKKREELQYVIDSYFWSALIKHVTFTSARSI